jgi:hypothetical protein
MRTNTHVQHLWCFHYLCYTVLNGRMVAELERIWKEVFMTSLRHHPYNCLEGPQPGMSKSTWDSNQALPKYKFKASALCQSAECDFENQIHSQIFRAIIFVWFSQNHEDKFIHTHIHNLLINSIIHKSQHFLSQLTHQLQCISCHFKRLFSNTAEASMRYKTLWW